MTLNIVLHRTVKALVLTLMLTPLIACQSESEGIAAKPELTRLEHDELVYKAKQAILDLDLPLLESLSTKIDVNRPLPDNSSLLAWAVETQDPRPVSLLLEKGAVAHTKIGNRFTPIIEACRYGNSAIINALLDHGGDPNSAIEDGTSAFHLCAGSASVDDLAKMISLGARIPSENDHGQTALMFAANFGKADNLAYLVDAGAHINKQTKEGYNPLFFAIKSQNLSAVKVAISRGADLSATAQDGTTAAQIGVYSMNYEFLTWFARELGSLLPAEAIDSVITAFDRDGYQLLHAAVKANQPELVSALLELGANPTTVSEPSKLQWRYEANFKTESYTPPTLSPIELAEQNDFKLVAAILRNSMTSSLHGI